MSDPYADTADWQNFAGRHAGNPFLACDPLYALSEPLIDAILGEVPRFFTEGQERFERDLARTAGFGFFLGRTYGWSEPPTETAGDVPTQKERARASSAAIDSMLREEFRRIGVNSFDTEGYFKGQAEQRSKIEERKDAYSGWLILDRLFRDEVRQLREKWDGAVRAAGRFPRLDMWGMPDPTEPAALPEGFRDECHRFYRRWGLDSMTTWEFPEPMEPDLNAGLRTDVAEFSSGGLTLFLPWYMLRGEKLDLREVLQRSRLASVPEHLLDWVNKRAEGKGDLGDVRYGTLHRLYRYFEMVLRRRYPAACKRRLEKLDRAFAKVIGRDADTIKKLRLELTRTLKWLEGNEPSG